MCHMLCIACHLSLTPTATANSPPPHNSPTLHSRLICKDIKLFRGMAIIVQFLDPFSSFSVGYKIESNNANDSKKEDLSQFFGI